MRAAAQEMLAHVSAVSLTQSCAAGEHAEQRQPMREDHPEMLLDNLKGP